MAEIGFVLLTHDQTTRAMRLVRKLNTGFGEPPIAWHHDFSQCDLPVEASAFRNVTLIQPHVLTRWGTYSLVEAILRGLQQLFIGADRPDWSVVLSGADYPIKTARQIIHDLAASPYDAHIEHKRIAHGEEAYREYMQERSRAPIPLSHASLCFERYCGAVIGVAVSDSGASKLRQLWEHSPAMVSRFLPFTDSFQCYFGAPWFCLRRAAVEYLLEFHRDRPALANHYRTLDSHFRHMTRPCIIPDESYFQTVLCNSDLKVSGDFWRYVDWSVTNGFSPKTLGMDDLPKLRASTAHFARKFDADAEILDALDNAVLA